MSAADDAPPVTLRDKARTFADRAVTVGGTVLIGAGAGTLMLAAFGYWRARRGARRNSAD